jgi:hypothetical protein
VAKLTPLSDLPRIQNRNFLRKCSRWSCLWTTATLSGPVVNLGGYATAQILVGTGPALSTTIAAVGGPIVVGTLAATGVGIAIVGLGYGGYHMYKWVKGKRP